MRDTPQMKDYWLAQRLRSGDRVERPGPFTRRQLRAAAVAATIAAVVVIVRVAAG